MITQAEYLSRLEYLLQDMPSERKWEVLDDIRRHFDEGIAAGIPEEDLAQSLGAPELLAREYLGEAGIPQPGPAPEAPPAPKKAPRSTGGGMGKFFRGLGMTFFGLVFVLAIFIALYAIWFSLLASGVAMVVAGIATSLLTAVNRVIPLAFLYVGYPLLSFVMGITVAAIGGLILMAVGPMGRWLFSITRRYFAWNRRVIQGGGAKHAAY